MSRPCLLANERVTSRDSTSAANDAYYGLSRRGCARCSMDDARRTRPHQIANRANQAFRLCHPNEKPCHCARTSASNLPVCNGSRRCYRGCWGTWSMERIKFGVFRSHRAHQQRRLAAAATRGAVAAGRGLRIGGHRGYHSSCSGRFCWNQGILEGPSPNPLPRQRGRGHKRAAPERW
jgi:hypothetical protein